MASAMNVAEFIEQTLKPKIRNVRFDLKDLLNQRKIMVISGDVPCQPFWDLNGRIQGIEKQLYVLAQQRNIVLLNTKKGFTPSMKIDSTLDQDFLLWLAEKRICADALNVEDLFAQWKATRLLLQNPHLK